MNGRGQGARLFAIALAIASAGFKVRYLDSLLGYVWAIARPAALFLVMYGVFTTVGNLDAGVSNYGAYLFLSLVLWIFFGEATATAVPSLVAHGSLLRRFPVPPLAIPLSVVLTAALNFAMSLVVVLVLAVATGVEPRLSWLQLPLLVAFLAAFAIGVVMLLSVAYVLYRDVDETWTLGRQLLFYASPVFYVVTSLPEDLQRWWMLNPLAVVMTQARHAVIDPSAPTAAEVAGGTAFLLLPLVLVLAALGAGLYVYHRLGPDLAERA